MLQLQIQLPIFLILCILVLAFDHLLLYVLQVLLPAVQHVEDADQVAREARVRPEAVHHTDGPRA